MTPDRTEQDRARDALRRIAYLRPAGDVTTCKNPRQLVEKMERIALTALAVLAGDHHAE